MVKIGVVKPTDKREESMKNEDANKKIKDYLSGNPDILDQVSEAMLRPMFKHIKAMYIDLVLIKDTRLGLMLGLAAFNKNDDMFNYLLEHIEDYNKSLARNFTSAYPDFFYPEKTLKAYYKDHAFSDLAFDFAPDTIFSQFLAHEVDAIMQQNDRSGTKSVLTITINAYPLALTDNIRKYAKALEGFFRGRVKIELITQDIKSFPESFWRDRPVVFCDDVRNLLSEDAPMCQAIMHEMQWSGHRLVCPYVADDSAIRYWKANKIDISDPEILKEQIYLTGLAITLAIPAFEFRHFTIPVEKGDVNE